MSPVKILLVDDEEIVRITLEGYLEDEGDTVISAISGEEALEMLADESIDIGIIDMRLPGIDGNTLNMWCHRCSSSYRWRYCREMVHPWLAMCRFGVFY